MRRDMLRELYQARRLASERPRHNSYMELALSVDRWHTPDEDQGLYRYPLSLPALGYRDEKIRRTF